MSKIFEVTEDHLKLLKKFYVGWQDCETGAPEINPKRPYGNSYVVGDVHEILTGESDYELTDEQEDKYSKLHRETQHALQIVLLTGKFEVGQYTKESEYDDTSWVKVEK